MGPGAKWSPCPPPLNSPAYVLIYIAYIIKLILDENDLELLGILLTKN